MSKQGQLFPIDDEPVMLPYDSTWKLPVRTDLERILTDSECIALDRFLRHKIEFQSFEMDSVRDKSFNLIAFAYAIMPANYVESKCYKMDLWLSQFLVWAYTGSEDDFTRRD